MKPKKRILVVPLNWGLGHATRCIPIIKALMAEQFEPIIACDGASLNLLKKEFSNLTCIELPSYNISYSKHGFLLQWQLFKSIPKLLKVIREEHKQIQSIIKTHQIEGLISDNRFGVYSINVPSVYITHQLTVFSGYLTSWLTSKIHQQIIKKHQECWIPDFENNPNLSGKLGHIKAGKFNLIYLGPLSRFTKTKSKACYDVMVLLSGPEPQRSLLEQKMFSELKSFQGKAILVKGLVETIQTKAQNNHITIYNFMTSNELEAVIQNTKVIISRSGYTSIMDLAKLEKKVFFIPTPGQREQQYLAKRFNNLKIAPYCQQSDFDLEKLKNLDNYSGFIAFKNETDYKTLFSLFKRE
ncbi:glycosyltransferase [Gaetbulibacter aquiaggeris]|uniref:Glycosyltransferase n=1 Tax=Gaetbulibacter aquiaggeris TaxID=1735373 RepID=A0ABW7MM20_9FLAO